MLSVLAPLTSSHFMSRCLRVSRSRSCHWHWPIVITMTLKTPSIMDLITLLMCKTNKTRHWVNIFCGGWCWCSVRQRTRVIRLHMLHYTLTHSLCLKPNALNLIIHLTLSHCLNFVIKGREKQYSIFMRRVKMLCCLVRERFDCIGLSLEVKLFSSTSQSNINI